MGALIDVAAAKGQDQVAGAGALCNVIGDLRKFREPDAAGDFRRQIPGVNMVGVFLAGTHNLGKNCEVGNLQHPGKLVQKRSGPGIGKGLMDRPDPLEGQSLGSLQSRLNLCGMVSVIVGDGDTVDFAQDVQKLGVDAFMLVVPYYTKPPQEGLYQHFKTIAESVDLPCILYNIPGRCVINMTAETTLRLANDVENIVAIKEASGNLEQVAAIIKDAPDGFDVYSGDDSLTYEMMKLGAAGVISTAGNVSPARMKEITTLCAAGNFEEAKKAHDAFLPLMDELFVTANPIMVKEALNLAGFPVGGVRLPLVNATEEQSAHLAQVMKEVGIL